MKSDDYMAIWQRIATKKEIKLLDDYSSIARRPTFLWEETFQRCINAYLREVTVAGSGYDKTCPLNYVVLRMLGTSGRGSSHTQLFQQQLLCY